MSRPTVSDGPWLQNNNWRQRVDTEKLETSNEPARQEPPVHEPQPAPGLRTRNKLRNGKQPPGFLPLNFRSILPSNPLPQSETEIHVLLYQCDVFFNQFRTQERTFWVRKAHNFGRSYNNRSAFIVKWILDQNQEYITAEEDKRVRALQVREEREQERQLLERQRRLNNYFERL